MALSAAIDWNIRTDGAAANGGGYKRTAGTTDYSKQAAAQLSVSDAACTTGGVIVTSATGGFTAAMVGNVLYLSGTHFTTGWYEIITYSDTNTITVDRDPTDGSNGSGGTLNVGGSLDGIGTLGLIFQTAAQAVAGMRGYIRGGTYNLANANVNTTGGPLDLDASEMDSKLFYLKGYATDAATIEDYTGDRPVINCNGNAPTQVIKLKGANNNGHRVSFVGIDGDSQAVNGIVAGAVGYDSANDCAVSHCDGTAAYTGLGCVRCFAYSCAAIGFSGGQVTDCHADSCDSGYGDVPTCSFCIASNNTGRGFERASGMAVSCVSYNNGSDGFYYYRASILINCISISDGEYSVRNGDANNLILYNFASDGAASGRILTATPFDLNPITLTADPFTNAAALDFSLNDAAGGGALCKAAGASPYGQTGYPDVGVVQSEGGGYTYGDEDASKVLTTAAGAGTYQAVAAANVRAGTAVGVAPAVGTLDLPAVADVKDGVLFDGETKEGEYPTTAATQAADAAILTAKTLDADGTDTDVAFGASTGTAKSGAVYSAGYSTGYSTGHAEGYSDGYSVGDSDGRTSQLQADIDEASTFQAYMTTDVVNLLGAVNGNLDMSLYVLKSYVVSASYVAVGNDNYAGGSAGTYPTTATSKAEQLAEDKAAVAAAVAGILDSVTILTHTGTYHEATTSEVQDGVMFGPSSAYEGTYEGSGGGGGVPVFGGHVIRR
jgi:hypothetical protein